MTEHNWRADEVYRDWLLIYGVNYNYLLICDSCDLIALNINQNEFAYYITVEDIMMGNPIKYETCGNIIMGQVLR